MNFDTKKIKAKKPLTDIKSRWSSATNEFKGLSQDNLLHYDIFQQGRDDETSQNVHHPSKSLYKTLSSDSKRASNFHRNENYKINESKRGVKPTLRYWTADMVLGKPFLLDFH
jgi:hypothetical protein